MPPLNSPIAKYHRVEISLTERIRSGAYADGLLPAERVLAEEFKVARVTIRHALSRLEERGLIARRQRRGTSATPDIESPLRRRLLREHVDQFLDRGRADQRKVLRFGLTVPPSLAAEALGLAPHDKALRVVRLRSRNGSPLTYTESYIPSHLAHVLDRSRLAKEALMQALESGGVKVAAAKQSVRSERCPEEIALALGIAPHEPVLRLERIVFDSEGAPVQFLLGWYRADCFEIHMEMSRADDVTRVWVHQRKP